MRQFPLWVIDSAGEKPSFVGPVDLAFCPLACFVGNSSSGIGNEVGLYENPVARQSGPFQELLAEICHCNVSVNLVSKRPDPPMKHVHGGDRGGPEKR